MSNESNFSKILESKVEFNYKISKVIANALNWQIDFNQFKAAKQVVLIPLKSEQDLKDEEEEKQAALLQRQRNE